MRHPREALTLAGAFLTAAGASACCIGPLLLAGLGLGGAAYAVALEPYRPWLIGVTLLLLGGAFRLVYGKRHRADCAPEDECDRTARRRGMLAALWIVTILALAALTFPYYVEYIS